MGLKIIYSDKHLGHNPPYEIYDGVKESYAEKPERVVSIVNFLREKGFEITAPNNFSEEYIDEVHHKEYFNFLKNRSSGLSSDEILYPSYFIMDTYTPIAAKTYEAARSSVDVALTGAKSILDGEQLVYSLCRPPGHHAEKKVMGGYCYFNNAAIVANYLSKHGKVAILDIDFHHGNGTQNIFYDRSDVLYVSIHADPKFKFPYSSGFEDEKGRGKGLGYNKNYPLPLGTTDEEYLKILQKTLRDVKDFNPKFLIVSAGFDAYEKDPIGGFKLTIPFYEEIGRNIQSLNLPSLVIQEGGYAIDALGKIAYNFLQGLTD
ncbi:MAG: histone deacetylase family protein [bacterium]|nr:histone deacetylase family protein [bacterium]